ncbi:predicted protein [Nematostella vectensis]|uniref:Fibrinogen C-terminal domain-containing protein n=1 Tax=Nematostella vectensis TaxID=45351 RepID=A7RQE4_NEMVE|nr:predicted protein [Nematostella vectensis]|eukprot:XP_001638339.1 predicted protein [Nematostella vectensis]
MSGVYAVDPDGQGAFQVFCDQKTLGGGWTVFQRRQDGSVDFYRNWTEYKNGFGDLQGEHWLGLDRIHRLTNAIPNEMRVDMEADAGETRYAQYHSFSIAGETDMYRIKLGGFTGNVRDSLTGWHNNQQFSTMDNNDEKYGENCAARYRGAWWFSSCHASNLNGEYLDGAHSYYARGMVWSDWMGHRYSLKRTEMKMRAKGFTP